MTLTELGNEYQQQADILQKRIDGLTPLLKVYKGEDLLQLRKRLKILADMKEDCESQANELINYYED